MARVTTGAVAGGEKHGTSYRGGFSDAELADRADDDPSDVVGQLRRRHGRRITQLVQLMFDRIEEAQRPARLSHSGCPSRCGSMRGFVARPDRPDQAPGAEGPAPTGPWKTDRRTLLEWKAFAFASLALEVLGRDVFALPLLVRKALAGELRVDDALDEAEERGQLIPGEPSPNEDVERPIGFGCGEHRSRVDLVRICHASLPALRESSELEVRAAREVTASFPSAPARARTTSGAVDSLIGQLSPASNLEQYEHHDPFLFPKWPAALEEASRILRQARRRASMADGESGCPKLAPGHRFALEDHPASHLDRPYVVTSVEHHAGPQPQSGEPWIVYRNVFECARAEVTYVPPRPKRKSVQVSLTATVVGPPGAEIHVDPMGQIKVQFHWN